MKLRIKGNSLRLRVSRSELARLARGNRVQETICFSAQPDAKLTYALELGESSTETTVRYEPQEVTVQIPPELARQWQSSDLVGLSNTTDLGPAGVLSILVEKDFACLDGNDADNDDTFPNPSVGLTC